MRTALGINGLCWALAGLVAVVAGNISGMRECLIIALGFAILYKLEED